MARMTLKERFEFDRVTDTLDRLILSILTHLSTSGHGDCGSCGVAEFDLIALAEAIDQPPGDTLRRMKRFAPELQAVCVERDNQVLFAFSGATQADFAHLYKRNGFEGLPPNLPKVSPRFMRV